MVNTPSPRASLAASSLGAPKPAATALSPADQAREIDRLIQAAVAPFTGGFAPSSLAQAVADWAVHSAFSPSRTYALGAGALRNAEQYADLLLHTLREPGSAAPAITPLSADRRFADPAWQQPPFSLMSQAFLLHQQWWHDAATGVAGVSPHQRALVDFLTRQMLDIWSPSNWLPTSPVIQARTAEERGGNLLRGLHRMLDDAMSMARTGQLPPPGEAGNYRPGERVALTPGKVVLRNRLIELLQYLPQTDTVHPEPIVIVPAWIMKYYILDLEQTNSLVCYLVTAGFTVFTISWHNPGATDRDLHFDDYRALGFQAAFDVALAITGADRAHVMGYCLGGTLATIGAATLARDDDPRVASLTLLAAQTDFTEPGELGLFISAAQIDFLESIMWQHGYLDSSQMGGAFQLLRSNDMIWSRNVQAYLLGKEEHANALMAWNADGTRMPMAMHSEYLRQLYLDNALVEGRFMVVNRPIALSDISAPIFAVGTERDHVAPWRSVHKITLLADTEVTFVLTSGGHNAGIVAEPGHRGLHYRIATHRADQTYVDAASWEAATPVCEGSWWPAWRDWLTARSAQPVAPPPLGPATLADAVLEDAPGRYVYE